MRVIVQTTDQVLLSYIEALLTDAGIKFHIADQHVSSIEGSIGAFPRRVLIMDEEFDEAIRILHEAGLGPSLLT